ncbi:hypothetical protein YYC_04181 [Plasmodium yoelii 17X]|uniref:C2H2-type domain-containing protein n=1 Tax=Plasmodium yoelii 17X TaxID=1323249 RepID=V7PII9_PLAYE|nr:hypothetical protein YYC_04181 [Plasmodium yoelii 17X]
MANDDFLSRYANKKKKKKFKFLDEEDIVKENNSLSKKNKDHVNGCEKAEKNKDQDNKCKDMDTKDNSKNLKCQICNQTFDSRNKLFEHIKTEGHMANKICVTPSKTKKKK